MLGGDQAYPSATREAYRQQFEQPYACAFRDADPPRPHLFAIPGNHDWYDGLVAFTRLFVSKR